MKVAPVITRCLTTGLLSLTLASFGGGVAHSGEHLLRLACADADGKPSNNFERSHRAISIGREFYQTVMRAYPGAQVTCEVSPRWNSLQIEFGLSDSHGGSSPVTLSAYRDGTLITSRTVAPGSVNQLTLNTNDAASINLELSCAGSSNCYSWVYFTQAELSEDLITQSAPQVPQFNPVTPPPNTNFEIIPNSEVNPNTIPTLEAAPSPSQPE